jgi:hypothetical protein
MTTIKYKVIAEYPDMILEVGQIVEGERTYVTSETKANLADYPHLFQEVKEETGQHQPLSECCHAVIVNGYWCPCCDRMCNSLNPQK